MQFPQRQRSVAQFQSFLQANGLWKQPRRRIYNSNELRIFANNFAKSNFEIMKKQIIIYNNIGNNILISQLISFSIIKSDNSIHFFELDLN